MDFHDLLSFVPGSTDPKNSAKIYFAGDEETFKAHFEAIEKQVLHLTRKRKTTCTIWFRKHFNPLSAEENDLLLAFLSHTQLIIAPVTRSLLTNANGVLQTELQFAKRANRRILPIMLENNLVELYSRPENFGDRQFLNPLDTDVTAIPFEKKLEDYLSYALISDATRARIQQEFDAYIFLSYRKKDRAEARKLMHLIHQNDFCRDVAIWYDEYLVPGEDFTRTIAEAMEKSHLFTLMVTPHVVEPDNYIIQHEYPMAQTLQKEKQLPILPVECVQTDPEILRTLYKNIPPCAQADTPESLADALRVGLKKVNLMEKRHDPEHNFLIGLGYLGGIDVETDYDRAISLITDAANAGLPQAKKQLIDIFQNGVGTPIDYKTALCWTDRLIDQYKELCKHDSSYGIPLTQICFDKFSLLNLMGDACNGEETLLDAIHYSRHLPMPLRVARQIILYINLANVKRVQFESKYGIVEGLRHMEESNLARLPALKQAEALAMEHQDAPALNIELPDAPTLARAIFMSLVELYSLYEITSDKENMDQYRQKVISFCEKHYPEGLPEFQHYCQMNELARKIDPSSLEGVETYLDAYFQLVEEKGIIENDIQELIRFTKSQVDVIMCSFNQETAERVVAVYYKCIYRLLSIFENFPLKEAGSDVLSSRLNLYDVAAVFEKYKGNAPAAFEARSKAVYVADEILCRQDDKINRHTYFAFAHSAVREALEQNAPNAALRIAKAAYDKWRGLCATDPDEDEQWVLVNIYGNLAEIFKMHNTKEDAIALYDAAVNAAIKLCNTKFTAKHFCRVAKNYNDFAAYQQENGNWEQVVFLCQNCLNACGTFMELFHHHPESVMITEEYDNQFDREYRRCLSLLSEAYRQTKQYEKQESLLIGFMDTWKENDPETWIDSHYNLATCLLCQGKTEKAAKYFEDYIALTRENVTVRNRYQYAMASYYAAGFIPEKAELYQPQAIENLLILYKENPKDKQIAPVLAQLLGNDLN